MKGQITTSVVIDFQDVKLNNLNFHPHDVVSRYRDPQLQVVEIIHLCLI